MQVKEKEAEQASSVQHNDKRRRRCSNAAASAVGAVRQHILSQVAKDETWRRVWILLLLTHLISSRWFLGPTPKPDYPFHNIGHAHWYQAALMNFCFGMSFSPLRGKWYCVMNTWNPREASCSMPEPEQDQNWFIFASASTVGGNDGDDQACAQECIRIY